MVTYGNQLQNDLLPQVRLDHVMNTVISIPKLLGYIDFAIFMISILPR